MQNRLRIVLLFTFAIALVARTASADPGVLELPAKGESKGKVVLVAGDEEYRSEEAMPMLGKILSVKHGFDCVVVFSVSEDGSYIDPNNQSGVVGLEHLDDADLMIIGTRFRQPSPEQAAHVTQFLNEGKPLIGIRTSTHAFRGAGEFGDAIPYGQFGRKVLGEQWVSHHGRHKVQGARSVVVEGQAQHPILNAVDEIFVPSDVYEVRNLTDADTILLRAAVTESLDPQSKKVSGKQNDPMQPFAWLHGYVSPSGTKGQSFCTTAGASVDLVDEDLRRLLVNAAYFLTGKTVPEKADVGYVDPFYPTFYGFVREPGYYEKLDLQADDFALGKSPSRNDPQGSPQWPYRDRP
jgi:hypothetical protein